MKIWHAVFDRFSNESFEIQEKAKILFILILCILVTVPVIMVTDFLYGSMPQFFGEGVCLLAIVAALVGILRGRYRLSATIFLSIVFVLLLFISLVAGDATSVYLAKVSFYMIAPVVLAALVGTTVFHTLLTGIGGLAVIAYVCFAKILPGTAEAGRAVVLGDMVSDGVIYALLGVVAFLILRINARTLQKMAGHSARQEELARRLREVAQGVSEASGSVFTKSGVLL